MAKRSRKQKPAMDYRSRGTFSALTAMLAFLILMPLGVLAFELQRAQLTQKQLRVVSDAAAMAAALAARDLGVTYADKVQYATNAAVQFVQRNNAAGAPFGNVATADSLTGVKPNSKDAVVNVTYDQTNQLIGVNIVYGYQPSFGKYLGLNNVPLTVNSKAGLGNISKSDIVIIFDASCSMFVETGGEPMKSARAAMNDFVDKLSTNTNIHLGLVTFGTKVSGSTDPSNSGAWPQYPVPTQIVPLDPAQGHNNFDQVKLAINELTTCDGSTNTAGAIDQATQMITGPGHRPDAQGYVLLVTDGMPNFWYPLPNAQDYNMGQTKALAAGANLKNTFNNNQQNQNNHQKIILNSLGFFHPYNYGFGTPDPMVFGPDFLNSLKGQAGGNGKVYIANNIQQFIQALNQMANSDLGLVN